MKCIHCKASIPDSSKYCMKCGRLYEIEKINSDEKKKVDTLINFYYRNGKRPSKFLGMNLNYLVFNFSYSFYKKMYAEGIAGLLNSLILFKMIFNGFSLIAESMGFYFLGVIMTLMLTLAINFNYLLNIDKIYMNYVRTNVGRITFDYENDKEKQLKECRKDGKPNILAAIGSVIIFIILFIFL